MTGPFNPLDYQVLGESIAGALQRQPAEPLAQFAKPRARGHRGPKRPPFPGAGIYVIYYKGAHNAYSPLVSAGGPIYVGKAVPEGTRKGGSSSAEDARVAVPSSGVANALGASAVATTVSNPSAAKKENLNKLFERLCEHRKSISDVTNLDLDDFECRYLVVEPVFIGLGESALIQRFMPVWNVVIDGFGNHDPGSGRKDTELCRWDTLHPGRPWARKYKTRAETPAAIEAESLEYLRSRFAPPQP